MSASNMTDKDLLVAYKSSVQEMNILHREVLKRGLLGQHEDRLLIPSHSHSGQITLVPSRTGDFTTSNLEAKINALAFILEQEKAAQKG